MKRFAGAGIALGALLLIGGAWLALSWSDADNSVGTETPQVFTFEKEDLVGITIERPDETLKFTLGDDGEWAWVDRDWRPSSSMVRRVGHQTHDLMARATVAAPGNLEEYGFGDEAITITLGLTGNRTLRFQAGVPNPTSVSWYVRPLPGDTVYVVKKSAVDYWRMGVEEFREDRFAALDADDAVTIDATVDGRTVAFKRLDERRWRQTAPIEQAADLQRVRTMLGRTAALRTSTFVEDKPQDLAQYGLAEPKHTVKIGLEGGGSITLKVGDIILGTEPQERFIYRVEDDAVYQARDGFLGAFVRTEDEYRDTRILYIDRDRVRQYTVRSAEYEPIPVRRTPDGWRWPDDAPINGMTPARLSADLTDPRAASFIDGAEELGQYGLAEPRRSVVVDLDDEESVTLLLGDTFEDTSLTPPEPRQYLMIAGDAVVYVVSPKIDERVSDLLNEYGKKLEGDEEKGLLETPEPEPPAPE